MNTFTNRKLTMCMMDVFPIGDNSNYMNKMYKESMDCLHISGQYIMLLKNSRADLDDLNDN
mgnify:CR=1 FL=1